MIQELFIQNFRLIRKEATMTYGNVELLLMYDNYTGHEEIESIAFADNSHMRTIALPLNSTHVNQPADQQLFGLSQSGQGIIYWTQYKMCSSLSSI